MSRQPSLILLRNPVCPRPSYHITLMLHVFIAPSQPDVADGNTLFTLKIYFLISYIQVSKDYLWTHHTELKSQLDVN